VEKFHREAVHSALVQGFSDFELILVDDGSPDGCPQICDEYAQLDDRVRVLHQANGGVSAARNAGIRASEGEYLVFLDGDDRLTPKALETLAGKMSGAKRPDVLVAKYVYYYSREGKLRDCGYFLKPFEGYGLDEVLHDLFVDNRDYGLMVWKHIYRREFVTGNNLFFDTSICICEDAYWLFQTFIRTESFDSVDEPIYIYRVDNPGSIVHEAPSMKRFRSVYFVYTHWFDYFSRYEGSARDGVLNRLSNGYINSAKWIHGLPAEDRREAVKMFMAHPEIYTWSKVRANRLLLPLLKAFGVVFYSRSLSCAHAITEWINHIARRR
jgi:glycosyltransferase involved in cell wall biosynthesis